LLKDDTYSVIDFGVTQLGDLDDRVAPPNPMVLAQLNLQGEPEFL
jgi:hypothetical protein